MASKRKAAARAKPTGKLQRYGDQALERLAWLMQHAESEQAQVAAAKELLGRAGGPLPDAAPEGLQSVVDRLRQLRTKP